MPRQKRQFENGEIYHVSVRRIAEEPLFLDVDDYYRGIFSIYEFNNSKPVDITLRRRERAQFKRKTCEGQTLAVLEEDRRDRLVDVFLFCLMPNHIHLLLRQIQDKGISRYMQKLGSGYAAHFFEKYAVDKKKKGHFFQDRFNAVRIQDNEQLMIIFVYIHTNGIALIEPGWKEKGILDPVNAKKFLEEEYRWSSYWDYLGKKNFSSVTDRAFLSEIMGGSDGCREAVNDWVEHKGEIVKIL